MRGPNCDSDHFLAGVKYKQEIMRIEDDKYQKRKKWNQRLVKRKKQRNEEWYDDECRGAVKKKNVAR